MNQTDKPRTKYVVVLSILAILTFSMATQVVSAFYVKSFKWTDSVNPKYYYDDDGYTETSSAASSWTVSGLFSYSSSTSSSPIHVHGVHEDGVSWDGMTTWTYNGGTLQDAQLKINWHYCDSYTSACRKSVICHELGHALALNENPDIETVRSVMNPYTNGDYSRYGYWGISTAQTDDLNGVDWIY